MPPQNYKGPTTAAGVVGPFSYEGGSGVKRAIGAQIDQVRTERVDPTAGDVDYRTGAAPWAAYGPYSG